MHLLGKLIFQYHQAKHTIIVISSTFVNWNTVILVFMSNINFPYFSVYKENVVPRNTEIQDIKI